MNVAERAENELFVIGAFRQVHGIGQHLQFDLGQAFGVAAETDVTAKGQHAL